jgi:hypothetical protein
MNAIAARTTATLALAATAGAALACTTPPPPVSEPPTFWIDIHGDTDGDGRTEIWVGQEVNLFGASAVPCACGIGFTPDFLNVVTSATVTNALLGVTVKNPDGSADVTPILTFDFARNSNTTSGLTGNDPSLNWFGFFDAEADLNPDDYTNDIVKLWFEIEIDTAQLGLFKSVGAFAKFGAGEGTPDGFPNFVGSHFQLGGLGRVPTPGAAAVLGIAGLAAIRRRR